MTIGNSASPSRSLLIWAVVWEIAGRNGASFHHSAPVAIILCALVEIVPTAAFGEALWITGKAFIIGNLIAIPLACRWGCLMGRSSSPIARCCPGSICSFPRRCRRWCR